MKQRWYCLALPLITLLLELLPYGAVCVFAPSPTQRQRTLFSYFSLVPYGYANFAPLLTALVSCLVLLLLVLYCVKGNLRLAVRAKNILYPAVVLSLGPLVFGLEYYSLVGGLITLTLAAQLVLLQRTLPKQHK